MDTNNLLTQENLQMLREKIESTPSLNAIWERTPQKYRQELLERVYQRAILYYARQTKLKAINTNDKKEDAVEKLFD